MLALALRLGSGELVACVLQRPTLAVAGNLAPRDARRRLSTLADGLSIASQLEDRRRVSAPGERGLRLERAGADGEVADGLIVRLRLKPPHAKVTRGRRKIVPGAPTSLRGCRWKTHLRSRPLREHPGTKTVAVPIVAEEATAPRRRPRGGWGDRLHVRQGGDAAQGGRGVGERLGHALTTVHASGELGGPSRASCTTDWARWEDVPRGPPVGLRRCVSVRGRG